MQQDLEIEFKNLLSFSEYQNIKETKFTEEDIHSVTQKNYYFDTKDALLKEQHSALRIRTTDSFNELTLKTPAEGFLMETNVPLTKKDVESILNKKEIKLFSYIKPEANLGIDGISEDTVFYLFNSMKTKRLEKKEKNHILVLDETTYQNQSVDYEFELESTEKRSGEKYFKQFLDAYSIPIRFTNSKIARAEENRYQSD